VGAPARAHVCLIVCDLKTSTMRRPRPELGRKQYTMFLLGCISSTSLIQIRRLEFLCLSQASRARSPDGLKAYVCGRLIAGVAGSNVADSRMSSWSSNRKVTHLVVTSDLKPTAKPEHGIANYSCLGCDTVSCGILYM
jgi:hypothetical protein